MGEDGVPMDYLFGKIDERGNARSFSQRGVSDICYAVYMSGRQQKT